MTLTGFNPATAGHSFQVQIGGNTSAVIGNGGVALNNAALAAAINVIPGFSGTVAVTNAGSRGFTVTFAGPSENTDVPSIGIVNLGCSPACTATVRENVKGTPPVAAGRRAGS